MQDNNPSDQGKDHNKWIGSICNESLVRCMKNILDLKGIENYREDLKKHNRKKNGRPFIIPDRIF